MAHTVMVTGADGFIGSHLTEELVKKGKIRSWGVSNLDTSDMKELFSVPNGDHCQVDQVLYHLGSRGIEYDLMPWLEEHQTPIMAY